MSASPLAQQLRERSAAATRSGALVKLSSRTVHVVEQGIDFPVHVLDRIRDKERATLSQRNAGRNPFLEIEPDLFVCELGDAHRLLLNKFPVVDDHALVVTREFEAQDAPVSLADFEALWTVLHAFDGLAFFNSGPVAGASQPHKHLQIIPLPLPGRVPRPPIEALLFHGGPSDGIAFAPALPFRHAVARTPEPCASRSTPREAAEYSVGQWAQLREAVAISEQGAFNLLMTRGWSLLVPRSSPRVDGIPVNAMSYAGSLLVRDDRELATLQRIGPLGVLARAGLPGHREAP